MEGKTEKTFTGQLSNVVPLNSFHLMQPRSTFRIQSGSHSDAHMTSHNCFIGKSISSYSSKFVLSIILSSSWLWSLIDMLQLSSLVPRCFSWILNLFPTFFLSFLPSSLLFYLHTFLPSSLPSFCPVLSRSKVWVYQALTHKKFNRPLKSSQKRSELYMYILSKNWASAFDIHIHVLNSGSKRACGSLTTTTNLIRF